MKSSEKTILLRGQDGSNYAIPYSEFEEAKKDPFFSQPTEQSQSRERDYSLFEPAAEELRKHPGLANLVNKGAEAVSPYLEDFQNRFEGSPIHTFSGGVTEGAGNSLISIGNLGNQLLGKEGRIPHMNLRGYSDEGPVNDIIHGAGNFTGEIAGLGGTFGALNKLTPRPKGFMGIFSDMLKGGASYYAAGEDEEGNRSMLGTALSAATGPFANNTKAKIAERVSDDVASLSDKFSKQYGKIFKTAKKSGIGEDMRVPNIHSEYLFKHTTPEFNAGLSEFLTKRTAESAHRAQSDLGKFIRAVQNSKKAKEGGLTSSKIKALEYAKDAQKKIRGSLHQEFLKAPKGKELSKLYAKTTAEYADEFGPYLKNNAISVFEASKKTGRQSKKLVKALQKDASFLDDLGGKYPEIELNELSNKAAKWGAGVGAIGLGGYLGIPKAIDFLTGSHD